jgi:hypothetical protein
MLILACVPAKDSGMKKVVDLAENLVVEAPTSVAVQKDSPVQDFDIVKFSSEGELIVTAYVGNAPHFPTEKCRGQRRATSIGPFKATEVLCEASVGGLFREVLVDLGIPSGWPAFLHFMQTAKSRPVGDAIIDSLRRKEKTG